MSENVRQATQIKQQKKKWKSKKRKNTFFMFNFYFALEQTYGTMTPKMECTDNGAIV